MSILGIFGRLGGLFSKVGKWASIGIGFMPYINQAMAIVEMISTVKGEVKRSQAVDLVKYLITTSENVSGRDLVNDAEVIKAMEALMDAIVAFQNLLAKKSA